MIYMNKKTNKLSLKCLSPSHANGMEGEFLVAGSRPTDYV